VADGTTPPEISPEALEGVAQQFADACSEELTALLGVSVLIRSPIAESVEGEEAAAHPAPVLDVVCRSEEAGLDVHLIMPRPEAVAVAGLQLGEDAATLMERGAQPLEQDQLASFQGAMKLLVEVLGRLLQESVGVTALQLGDVLEVAEPSADGGFLAARSWVRLSFDLGIEGFPKGALEVLVASGAAGAAAPPLIVFDPCPEQRRLVEGFAADLGRPVETLDPGELARPDPDELLHAGAVLIAWDLGGRPGLEWVEELVRDERTREVPLLLSSDVPTRGMVAAALRAGAQSFVSRPYGLEQVRSALPAAAEEGAES